MPIMFYESQKRVSTGYKTIVEGGRFRSITWVSEASDYLECYVDTIICMCTLEYPYYADDVSVSMAQRRPSIFKAFKTLVEQNDFKEGDYFESVDASRLCYNVVMIPICVGQNDDLNPSWLEKGLTNLIKGESN